MDLSWNRCSPIEANVDPGEEWQGMLFVSVLGHSDPHKAYEFWMVVGDESNGLPDAWRFDAEGCQGPTYLTIYHLIPSATSKTCLSFQGALASIQIKEFMRAPEHLGFDPSLGVIVLANSYPAGNPGGDPNQRRYLGAILFDHPRSVLGEGTPGVSCGGFETPLCFTLYADRARYVDLDGAEHHFGNGTATVRGGCDPVPAGASTWGALKGRYRR